MKRQANDRFSPFVTGLAALALLFAAGVGTPARAEDSGISLRFTTGGLITSAPEFELVSAGEGMPSLGAIAGLGLVEKLELELGLAYAGARAPLFGAQQAGLRLLTLALGVAYHQPLVEVLGLSLRAGLLGDLGRLSLRNYGGNDHLRGYAAGFGLQGLAGLEIQVPVGGRRGVPARQSFRLGLEAGYRWRPAPMAFHRLTRRTARERDPARIALDPVDAGTLRLSSVVVQVSAGLAF